MDNYDITCNYRTELDALNEIRSTLHTTLKQIKNNEFVVDENYKKDLIQQYKKFYKRYINMLNRYVIFSNETYYDISEEFDNI